MIKFKIAKAAYICVIGSFVAFGFIPKGFCGNEAPVVVEENGSINSVPHILTLDPEIFGIITSDFRMGDLVTVSLVCKTFSKHVKSHLQSKKDAHRNLVSKLSLNEEKRDPRLEKLGFQTLRSIKFIVSFFPENERQSQVQRLLRILYFDNENDKNNIKICLDHFSKQISLLEKAAPDLFSGNDRDTLFSHLIPAIGSMSYNWDLVYYEDHK